MAQKTQLEHGGNEGVAGRTQGIKILAKALHSNMERLDPTGRPDWSVLAENERHFYRERIEYLLRYEEIILPLLEIGSSGSPATAK